ncbi:hypothetical protein [Pseudomonas sp. B11(2017)]|uniref:hypothetical protein n=1 Tax=Pseudomonas sp. B11(2017) TaxID=1981748 RepID=UPI00111C6487|nr:hypothetical protein [Pseudomonas sp. B11(2017)]
MDDELKHQPLFRTIWFWLAILVPIFIALCLGGSIWASSNIGKWCFESGCVNYFVEVFKVPITIAGLSLPLVAMVAAVQRSKEAYIQIRHGQKQYSEAVSNNRVGNYLKHREGFYKLIENFCEIEAVSSGERKVYIDTGFLYMRLFPNNSFELLEFVQGTAPFWKRLDGSFSKMETFVSDAEKNGGDLDLKGFITELQTALNVFTVRIVPFVTCKLGEEGEESSCILLGERARDIANTATFALRLLIAVKIYAGIKVSLSAHRILYDAEFKTMLEELEDEIEFVK